MLGLAAKSDTVCRGQPLEQAQPPISNRRALRSAGCQPAFFHRNLSAESHELKFLIACAAIRNRHNSNKTKDGPDF
jgi:hypothetical protein